MNTKRYWWCLGFAAAFALMRGNYTMYDDLRDKMLALPRD